MTFGISNEFIAYLMKVIFFSAEKLYISCITPMQSSIKMSHSDSAKTVNWYETMKGMKYYALEIKT